MEQFIRYLCTWRHTVSVVMRAQYFMVITRSRQKLIEMENCFFSQCGLNVDITNYCCILSHKLFGLICSFSIFPKAQPISMPRI